MRGIPFAGMSRREFLAKATAVGGAAFLAAWAAPAGVTNNAYVSYSPGLPSGFPRLAGMLNGSPHTYDDVGYQQQIAKLDVALLGMYNQWYGSGGSKPYEVVDAIKALNPGILLGNYTIMTEVTAITADTATADLRAKLNGERGPAGVGDWWAYTADGQHTSHYGQNTRDTNLTLLTTPDSNGDHWPQWLAKRDNAQVISNANFDIWYSDACFYKPAVIADWNRDGTNDDPTDPMVQNWWRDGQRAYYDTAKSLQPNKLLMLNADNDLDGSVRPGGQSFTQYTGVAHAAFLERMIGERWSPETKTDGWAAMMDWYHRVFINLLPPKMVVFNGKVEPADYQTLRYAFGSCLLDNGYFSVSDDRLHNVVWYDEFDLAGTSNTKWLGAALDPPQTTPWSNGVYRREFFNGLVLVNPKGNGSQTVKVGAGFRRFTGTQDPTTNNGAVVESTVTLGDRDGLFLART